jgi:hypothetical protein
VSNRLHGTSMIPYFGTLAAVLFSLCLHGCGVEVGNPTEPTPTQPKDSNQPLLPGSSTIPIENIDTAEPVEPVKINVRSLVENQYDETITAALDFAFENTGASLTTAANSSRSCGQQPDGSLTLNHQETNSGTRNSGAGEDSTLVTESFSRVFSSSMQSPDAMLACNTSLTRPKLDWSILKSVTTDGTLERTNSRLVVMNPSKEFVRESSIKATGSHQSMVKKLEYSPMEGLKLERTLLFKTDMEIHTRLASAAPTVLNTHIETAADGPLLVTESYNEETRLKSLRIVSGTVSSRKQDDGLTVIMRYENLVLDIASSCRPVSGKITGEILSPGSGQVQDTFSMAFTSKASVIVYADGTASTLELEPCRIETDAHDNGQGRGNGNNDTGGR